MFTRTLRMMACANPETEESIDTLSALFASQCDCVEISEVSLKNFEALTVIGKGAYGKIVLCREKGSGSPFAMKILKKEVLCTEKKMEHALTEHRVLKKLSHPFIISLQHSFQNNNHLFFVMEYLVGGDLFFYLSRIRIFSDEVAAFYGAEIVLAVAYLHREGIIHRDIKLENIVLDKHGHIKIVDFGLCKENITYERRTKTFCGTPEYLAPEMVKREGYGREVDWWGVGVVLYEMLCGKPPFYIREEGKLEELFKLITNEEVKYPTSISPEAKDMLKGLLEKDPKRRLCCAEDNAKGIMEHSFFRCINWSDLESKKVTPPFKPIIKNDYDTKYFDAILPEKQHSFSDFIFQDSVTL